MNEKELNKHFNSLSFRDLMFDPLFNTEYPYRWTDENGSIIFSKYPRYSIDKYTMTEYIDLKNRVNKAINLLNEPQFEFDNILCNYENDIEKLKNILRGDE